MVHSIHVRHYIERNQSKLQIMCFSSLALTGKQTTNYVF